jgi:hypothetical protein
VKLDEHDKHKNAFVRKYSLYQYTKLPFDLCNSTETLKSADPAGAAWTYLEGVPSLFGRCGGAGKRFSRSNRKPAKSVS